jgi:excisionase family DNA binding protein
MDAVENAVLESPGLSGLEPLLSVRELAAYLGVPVSTIYDWRSRGLGPVAHRFGKHVKFARSDVAEWLAAQREDRVVTMPVPSVGR